jgi:hypothetical protein
MKAKKNNIIVKVDLEQKEKHVIEGVNGEKIELYIGREYAINKREANPCVGEVVHNPNEEYPYIKEGDMLVLHYNTFENVNYLIEKTGTIALYSIPLRTHDWNNKRNEWEWNWNYLIFGKIVDGEIHPLCNNLICERIKMPQQSEIIINPVERNYPDRVKCLRVSPEIDYIEAGQTLMIKKMGDYEIVLHIGGREARVIKTWQEDVIAIINEN